MFLTWTFLLSIAEKAIFWKVYRAVKRCRKYYAGPLNKRIHSRKYAKTAMIVAYSFPLPMEELQKKLMELLEAVNIGKDSL
jgi:hypothetical protein